MLMTYSHVKLKGQRSAGSEDRVETNGRTDGRTVGGDCITSLANAVSSEVRPLKSSRWSDANRPIFPCTEPPILQCYGIPFRVY